MKEHLLEDVATLHQKVGEEEADHDSDHVEKVRQRL
jgi:hypothetical protein